MTSSRVITSSTLTGMALHDPAEGKPSITPAKHVAIRRPGNLQRIQRIGASILGLANDLGGTVEDAKADR